MLHNSYHLCLCFMHTIKPLTSLTWAHSFHSSAPMRVICICISVIDHLLSDVLCTFHTFNVYMSVSVVYSIQLKFFICMIWLGEVLLSIWSAYQEVMLNETATLVTKLISSSDPHVWQCLTWRYQACRLASPTVKCALHSGPR